MTETGERSSSKSKVIAVFDSQLNYIYINSNGCRMLRRDASQLLGKCIVDLFPEIIASRNHRNLLKAACGQRIKDVIEAQNGVRFVTRYRPIVTEGKISSIVVHSVQEK